MPALSLPQVRAAMLEKLRNSLLTEKHAVKLRIQPMTEDMATKAGVDPAWAGFMLTYFDPDGVPVPTKTFYRYRFWPESRPSKGIAAIAKPSDLRYVQPKNSELRVYMPPVLPVRWVDLMLQDEKKDDIYITEGELKSACACVNGIPMLGLGGVFSWMSKKHKQPLIPILAQFNWEERKVYLCFDSDMKTKPMVQLAAARLASTLTARGAIVYNVDLPNNADGGKLGVDDYMALYGVPSFKTLISTTHPLKSSQELHQLNEEVAFIWEGGAAGNLVRLVDGALMKPAQFTQAMYRDRVYIDFSGGANATPKQRYAADEWMSWPYRLKVRELTYKPGQDRLTDDGCYNIYKPGTIVPKKGDLTLWNELLSRMMVGTTPAELLWLKRWLAFPLRNPGAKLHSCVLIWSKRGGSGKNLLSDCMIPLYGSHNCAEITSKELSSDFNEWAEGRQFVVGDEIMLDDKLHNSGLLKGIVTGASLRINRKGINAYFIPNCMNFYFASNSPVAILLDEGERRTFVHRAPDQCVDEVIGDKIGRHFVGDAVKKDGGPGASALLHYLLYELDMGNFVFNTRPPITEAKAEQLADSRSEIESWAMALKEDPDRVLNGDGAARSFTAKGYQRCAIYTPKDLLTIYDGTSPSKHTTTVAMGRALDLAGFKKARYNNAVGPRNVRNVFWIIRDDYQGRVPTSAEAAADYMTERGISEEAQAELIKKAALTAKQAQLAKAKKVWKN